MMPVRVISLWQPWATLVAVELKLNETRSWATNYRGPLAIHAAKYKGGENRDFYSDVLLYDRRFSAALTSHGYYSFDRLPFGSVVAVGQLAGCRPTEECSDLTDTERLVGNYEPGRYAWALQSMRQIAPIPMIGRQGLFLWDAPAQLFA